jgi:hypothetical protein
MMLHAEWGNGVITRRRPLRGGYGELLVGRGSFFLVSGFITRLKGPGSCSVLSPDCVLKESLDRKVYLFIEPYLHGSRLASLNTDGRSTD